MKNLTKSISALVTSIIVLVVGILCIVAGASDATLDAYKGISLTIGISLIVACSLVLILALVAAIMSKGKLTFGAMAIGVSVALALGIFFVANDTMGGQLIALFLDFIPYVLIVTGSIAVVDGLIVIILGAVRKETKSSLAEGIVSIGIGAVAVLFGALMIGNDPVISKKAQFVIFGIILIIYALALCGVASLAIVASKKANKEEKKDSIDAEVKEVNEEKTTEETASTETKAE